MMGNFGMTQEQVSKSVGKSRPYIANSMRLLKLPEYIRESISEGKLTAGHGRTLITVTDEKKREEIWEKIIDEGLSVRETEKLVASEGKTKKRTPLKKKMCIRDSKGYAVGLASEERYARYLKKKENVEREMKRLEEKTFLPSEVNDFLETMGTSAVSGRISMAELLKRPQITYESLKAIDCLLYTSSCV